MTGNPRDIRTIKGLSERRRLPRLGKIRLGIKQMGEAGPYPSEVSFFVIPPEVARIYGHQPKALRILLPSEDPLQVFPQAYKWYGEGSGLKCKGDGETALRRWADVEPATQRQLGGTHDPNDLVEIPCPCARLKSDDCGIRAHLMVLLPDVSLSGVYQIDTTSWWNVVEINSAIELHRGMLGRIALIPLTLRREPVEMTHNGKRRTHYLLKLTFDGDAQAALRLRAQSLHNPAPIFALPAPHDNLEPGTLPSETPVEPRPKIQHATTAGPTVEDRDQADERHIKPTAEPTETAHATGPDINAPAEALTLSPPPGPAPEPGPNQCRCGTKVSATVASYSRKHFDEVLCFNCQRKQATPASSTTDNGGAALNAHAH